MKNNIIIRQASMKDKDNIIKLCCGLHSMDKSSWFEIMMDGRHPYTTIENFIIAEDTDTGEVVGNATYMPWTFLYNGTPIAVARIEEVIINPQYRGLGISKRIFDYLHELSEENNDVMQVVFGRPGFYKHLGYTLALPNEEEGKAVAINSSDKLTDPNLILYHITETTENDLPFIQAMLANIHKRNMICTYIGEKELNYTKYVYDEHSINVIKNKKSDNVGIINHFKMRNIYWLEISDEVSFYDIRPSLMNYLFENNIEEAKFKLGANHPFYQVLGDYCKKDLLTISGYARISNISKFLLGITPVLNKRIAASVYRGFTGAIEVSLSNKSECYSINLSEGKVSDVKRIVKDYGHVGMLRDYLIQLILGRKSVDELQMENAEVFFANSDYRQLMGVLFPKKDSHLNSLN